MRKVVCALPLRQCPGCLLLRRCPYPAIFETLPTGAEQTHTPHPGAQPHPFVLTPPLEKEQHLQPGDPFYAELLLMGPARDALPYLCVTCQEM